MNTSMTPPRPRLLAGALLALLAAGCETYPKHPVTQSAVPFDHMVETSPKQAPTSPARSRPHASNARAASRRTG